MCGPPEVSPALAIRSPSTRAHVRTARGTPAQPTSCDGMRRPPSKYGNVCPRGTTGRSARAVLRNPATRGCPKQNPGSARLSVNATQTTSSQTTHAKGTRLPRHNLQRHADADIEIFTQTGPRPTRVKNLRMGPTCWGTPRALRRTCVRRAPKQSARLAHLSRAQSPNNPGEVPQGRSGSIGEVPHVYRSGAQALPLTLPCRAPRYPDLDTHPRNWPLWTTDKGRWLRSDGGGAFGRA